MGRNEKRFFPAASSDSFVLFFNVLLSFVVTGSRWAGSGGKKGFHVLPCTNQDLATFQSKPGDSCLLMLSAGVNHTAPTQS